MRRQDILVALHQLEIAFRRMPPDKIALYADVLEKKQITETELQRGILGCVESYEHFPSLSQILLQARPVTINAPRLDAEKDTDAISLLEAEITVQTGWLRRFEAKGDEYHSRMARLAIERAQEKINNRLRERGLGTRYVAVGVEEFGADEMPRHQTERWSNEPELD